MASLSSEENGRRVIQFTGGNGRRQSFRVGKCSRKQAETAKLHVEDLLACAGTGARLQPATADWIAGLPERIRRRAERVGLIAPKERSERLTVAEWITRYMNGRSDVKPTTRFNYEMAFRAARDFFGQKALEEVTPADADALRVALKAKGLAEGTIRRRCGRVKQFFAAAVKRRLLAENPFDGLKVSSVANAGRFHFVTVQEVQAVLEACPNAEWRLIFALARWGGLRCPTEIMALRWGDVDWERNRFMVHASKTEHEDGAGVRWVPIFPELLPHLLRGFDLAEPGTEHVITRYRDNRQNLRTQLARIIRRAGLTPWPKLFQNCRSTRETELAETFPMHVVCAWIGNSQPVAKKHYLQVTEAHFQKAVQIPVQRTAAPGRAEARGENDGDGKPLIYGPAREGAAQREVALIGETPRKQPSS